MCRWFAYISHTEDCLLQDVLVTPTHSLSKQVHEHYLPKLLSHDPGAEQTTQQEITTRNRLFNVDGFGVAWYTDAQHNFGERNGPRPALYKTIQPPLHDANFRSLCANTATKTVFAHIRAATATAITPVNNHPFVFGRHTFMHNGYISDFILIKQEMSREMDDDSFANISGTTDSEHFAALYMTYLAGGKGKAAWEVQHDTMKMEAAMQRAVNTVIEIQKKKIGAEAPPNDLNIVTTDGTQLVAFRFRNHETEQPPSLYYLTSAGVTLNRKYPDHPDGKDNKKAYKKSEEHGSHVIVASEPTTYKAHEWNLIDKNHSMAVKEDGSVRLGKVAYLADGDAVVRKS